MDYYLFLKWLHIVNATVLVGVGFGTAFYKWAVDREGDVRAIAVMSRLVVRADWMFTTPAIVIQPVTGIAMAMMAGIPLTQAWIAGSISLYLVAGLCWIPVVVLQYRMRDLARAANSAGGTLPPEYWRYRKVWVLLGIPAFAAMLGTYALMVYKP